jgi:hypothetical protein
MGELTRQTLIELGSFREIYYPVEPRNAPPLRVAIEAVGRAHEKPGIRTLKVLFIVALGFLPVGVVTFEKDFTLEAKATFWRNGTVLQQLDLATSARMSSTLLYDRATAEEALAEVMFQHLAAQLAVGLSRVARSSCRAAVTEGTSQVLRERAATPARPEGQVMGRERPMRPRERPAEMEEEGPGRRCTQPAPGNTRHRQSRWIA